ncbi:MAG: chloride channel protein [Erysipelotrichaceae bacterium]|nr:chloride channel protein [Erysipelotrichaceae bacterium]
MHKDYSDHLLTSELTQVKIFLKWLFLAVLCGLIIGLCASAFAHCLHFANETRIRYPWLVWCLPIGGLVIVALYRFSGVRECKGTNLVISSIRSDDSLPLKMAPLIFIATVITHLVGGSAGREGAALQLGGSMAHRLGQWLHLNDKDIHIITMCGMSAAFSALFQTPISAAIFPMEVVSVGIFYYAALVPCALASIIATALAAALGVGKEAFPLSVIPKESLLAFLQVIVLASLCALLARLFCLILHGVSDCFTMYVHNQYVRIVVGAFLLLIGAGLFGHSYLGAGMEVIERCLNGEVIPFAFVIKMILTAITLGCGFKGGEIVPSFFIGAAFGAWIGSLFQMPVPFAAAIGFMSVFCGVTNCPIASLFISFELFGFVAIPYFLIADAVAYMLSGYESLYHEQRIIYSKFSAHMLKQNRSESKVE